MLTCLWWERSFILPTRTRGTSCASPRALRRASLMGSIRSNVSREVMENTRAYPCTPTDALRDRREYSSCVEGWAREARIRMEIHFHFHNSGSSTMHNKHVPFQRYQQYLSQNGPFENESSYDERFRWSDHICVCMCAKVVTRKGEAG